MKWRPPSDWVRAATYDPSIGIGQFFGNQLLKEGHKTYIVKFCRVNADVNDRPTVQNMMTKEFYPLISEADITYQIRGWDSRNDRNSDGYVDDTEFSNLVNPTASARFRYESRVAPLGNMWGEFSDFQTANFLNPSYRTAIATATKQQWIERGQVGAYNDDAFKLTDNVNVITGGMLKEGNIHISDPIYQELYQTNFFGGQPDFMSIVRQITLPGYYHRVNYDGTLQPASNTITLTGYEGVVLLKANQ